MKGVSANFGNQPAPASSPSGDTRVPDPLIPLLDPYTGAPLGQPFYVDEEANQPIFVDLQVPKGTAAGTYTGKVHVTSAHGQSADVPLSVVVWDLDLPDMRSVTTHFKMSTENLLAYHKDTATCAEGSCYLAETPESKKIVKRYQELAHSHRIDTAQEFVVPPSSGSDGCAVPTDWSDYDAAMAPYMDGSYWSDGVPSSRLEAPFSPGETFGPDGSCNQAQYVALARTWASHLKSKGWFEKAIAYAFDEPEASDDPTTAINKIAHDSGWLQKGDRIGKPR